MKQLLENKITQLMALFLLNLSSVSSIIFAQDSVGANVDREYVLDILDEAKTIASKLETNVQVQRCLAIGFCDVGDFESAQELILAMVNPEHRTALTQFRIRQPMSDLPYSVEESNQSWNRKSNDFPSAAATSYLAMKLVIENNDLEKGFQKLSEVSPSMRGYSQQVILEWLLRNERQREVYERIKDGQIGNELSRNRLLLCWIAKAKPDEFDDWISSNGVNAIDEAQALVDAGNSDKAAETLKIRFDDPKYADAFSGSGVVLAKAIELAKQLNLDEIADQIRLNSVRHQLDIAEKHNALDSSFARSEMAALLYSSQPDEAIRQLDLAVEELSERQQAVVTKKNGKVSAWEVAPVVRSAILCEKYELLQQICDSAVSVQFGTNRVSKAGKRAFQMGLERLLMDGEDRAFWDFYRSSPDLDFAPLNFGTLYDDLPEQFRFEEFHHDKDVLFLGPATLAGSTETRQKARKVLLPKAKKYLGSVFEDQEVMDRLEVEPWNRASWHLKSHAGFWGERFATKKEMVELVEHLKSSHDATKTAVYYAYISELIKSGQPSKARDAAHDVVRMIKSTRERARCYSQLATLFIGKKILQQTAHEFLLAAAELEELERETIANGLIQVDAVKAAFEQMDRIEQPKQLELFVAIWSNMKLNAHLTVTDRDEDIMVIKPVEEWECDGFQKRLKDAEVWSAKSANYVASCYALCNAFDKAIKVLDSYPNRNDDDTLDSRITSLIVNLVNKGHSKPALELFLSDNLSEKKLETATQLVWSSNQDQIRQILIATQELSSESRIILLLSAADRLSRTRLQSQ